MLGKLAKWLLILGFDTVYFNRIEDDDLQRLAREQGRVLLTRDGALRNRMRGHPALLVASEDWRHQLRQVLEAYDLRSRCCPWSRCLICNRPLRRLESGRALNLVPPHVLKTASGFALCPGCGRVFWKGTHHADMERRLEEILSPSGPRSVIS
jgi:uncharacterized protein with PIN domain